MPLEQHNDSIEVNHSVQNSLRDWVEFAIDNGVSEGETYADSGNNSNFQDYVKQGVSRRLLEN